MSLPEQMTTLLQRIEHVLAEGWVPDKKAWAVKAGLSEGLVRSWISQAKRLDPDRGMHLSTVAKLAKAAGVSVEWLAHGTGEPRSTLNPEEDARRWFLHRVEHEGLASEAEALAWLEANAPPFTRPVPWNELVTTSFRDRNKKLPDDPLAGGVVLFLDHVRRHFPERLAAAQEHTLAYKAAKLSPDVGPEEWMMDILEAFNRKRKGVEVRSAPDDDSEYEAEVAKRAAEEKTASKPMAKGAKRSR